jgi:hypothetical protein
MSEKCNNLFSELVTFHFNKEKVKLSEPQNVLQLAISAVFSATPLFAGKSEILDQITQEFRGHNTN